MDYYNVTADAHKVDIFGTFTYHVSSTKNISYRASAETFFYYMPLHRGTSAPNTPPNTVNSQSQSQAAGGKGKKKGKKVAGEKQEREAAVEAAPTPAQDPIATAVKKDAANLASVDVAAAYYKSGIYANPLVVSHLMAGNEISIPIAPPIPGHPRAAQPRLSTASVSSTVTPLADTSPSSSSSIIKTSGSSSGSGSGIKISAASGSSSSPVPPLTQVVQPPDDTIDSILQERYRLNQQRKRQRRQELGVGVEVGGVGSPGVSARGGAAAVPTLSAGHSNPVGSSTPVLPSSSSSIVSGPNELTSNAAGTSISSSSSSSSGGRVLSVNESAVQAIIRDYIGRSDVIYSQRPLYVLSPPSDHLWYYGPGVSPAVHNTDGSTGGAALTVLLSVCRRCWVRYKSAGAGLLLRLHMYSYTERGSSNITYDVTAALNTEVS